MQIKFKENGTDGDVRRSLVLQSLRGWISIIVFLLCVSFVFHISSCENQKLIIDAKNYTVYEIGGQMFNYYVIGLADEDGNSYVLLSPKEIILDESEFSKGKKLIELDSTYNLRLKVYETRPSLDIRTTGIAPHFKAYYLPSGPLDSPDDTGMLLWKNGEILIDVFNSEDVIDLYVKNCP